MGFLSHAGIPISTQKGEELLTLPRYSISVKLIADRLLPSRAWFLLGFTILKIYQKKGKKEKNNAPKIWITT